MLKDGTLDALFPYQREGVEWLRRNGSALLADERGLGKSLQVLVDYNNLRTYRPQARMLIVAPNNVIYKWGEVEVPKWTNYSVDIASGTAKQRQAALCSGADITVIAYDNLARERDRLNANGYYSLVFDEAHRIKNRKALWTQAAFSLRGARRLMVTGSPFHNRVDELWPLLFMVAPVEFPNYWQFVNKYCVFGGYEGRQIVGAQNVADLRRRLAPYMLRRLLEDVAQQIPPLTVVPVEFDLSAGQRKTYEQARNELKVEFEGKVVHEFENPLTKFIRLRQIINTLASVGGPDDSAKLDRVVDLIDEIGDHKVVVFSGDITALRSMRKRLLAKGIDAPVIAGTDEDGKSTNAKKREPVVQAFQTEKEPRVLLASHGVAREGIDLYAAHYGIVLDAMWVPELQDQEYGRLQRTGQQFPVTIFKMLARNTVDSRVEAILAEKRFTFNQVIGEDKFMTNLIAKHAKQLLAA